MSELKRNSSAAETRNILKSILPKSLFARAVLILVLPLILVQLVVAIIFFDRHWEEISSHLGRALASEMGYVVSLYMEQPGELGLRQAQHAGRAMQIATNLITPQETATAANFEAASGLSLFPDFSNALRNAIAEPFMIEEADKQVHLYVRVDDGLLHLSASRKRLVSVTTTVFWLTMCVATILFVSIALCFLRNQILPIRQLARAADRFGMGKDTPDYSPRGAREVRQAGEAFLTMRDRIRRQLETRTDMLVGISHDLRTPLSQIKLQLSLAEKNPALLKEMHQEVDALEHMVNEYLSFAQSNNHEAAEETKLHSFVQGLVDSYRRDKAAVTLTQCDEVSAEVRPHVLRRAIQNLIDNALHYGQRADVSLSANEHEVRFTVTDGGAGIPADKLHDIFQPFVRLESAAESHNGVGLGLTITQDIVHQHGGVLALENMLDKSGKVTGLCATITLPLQMH